MDRLASILSPIQDSPSHGSSDEFVDPASQAIEPSKESESKPSSTSGRIRAILQKTAKSAPLVSAVIAPVITLLDIPALSQRWYFFQGVPAKDPPASIGMSVVSLVFCALGNILLVIRFSANQKKLERWIIPVSTFAFCIKTVVEIVNIAVYGASSEKPAGYVHAEGFWSAVYSCGLSGVVAVLLMFHLVAQKGKDWKDSIRVRVDGRHFMESMMAFVLSVGIQALIFSKLEGWYYFDGLFFSIVATLTVGYGDLAPTKASTKVLLFPCALITISLLANQVSIILNYLADRTQTRKLKWRAQKTLLKTQSQASKRSSDHWDLHDEILYLEDVHSLEEALSQSYDLIVSFLSFLSFWLLGSVVFKYTEGWSYGNAVYFSYVTFLTMGFGDYSPASAAGRVFFIVYGLVAVPLVASFAVQTVATVLSSAADKRWQRSREARERISRDPSTKPGEISLRPYISRTSSCAPAPDSFEQRFVPHSTFVKQNLETAAKIRKDLREKAVEESVVREELAKRTLRLACMLEANARSLLIATLPAGSKAQMLLKADRNIQRRDMETMLSGESSIHDIWDYEDANSPLTDETQLESIKRYRENFAKFLVAGSLIRQLEEPELSAFLRTPSAPSAPTIEQRAKTIG
ncbi:Tandem pore domain K channel [Phaffia rhodozyma]|uniref:Tandem pore domain K channel n=1 Tax=Phaffia rhodozyma TaxID=264483 RepID=A0A0F7SIP8_PHARH|nr:Tandem pore domain K channel [Phaffia rhodozyma]